MFFGCLNFPASFRAIFRTIFWSDFLSRFLGRVLTRVTNILLIATREAGCPRAFVCTPGAPGSSRLSPVAHRTETEDCPI